MTRCDRSPWLLAIVFFAASGCMAAPALASPSDSLLVPPGSLRLTDIHGRERLRLRLLDEQCIEATHDGLDGSRLLLESRRGDIAVDSIAAMWVRRSHGTRGTMNGVALGLVLGSFLTWQDDDPRYLVFMPLGGALLGSLLGSSISRWEPVQLQAEMHDMDVTPCDPTHCLPCRLADLRSGNRVRVEAYGGRYLEGEIDHGSTEAVSVRVGLQTDDIARSDIERLWVRRSAAHRHAATGVKIMAPIGAVLGGLLFGALSQWCWESCTERPSPVLPALVGAVTGGAVGAMFGWFLGAATGAPFHSWVQLYP